jgi:hypothetical protein
MNPTTLRTLWTRNNITALALDAENTNRQSNDVSVKTSNQIIPFIKKVQEFTSAFELLNELTVDGEVVSYFKQWQVIVYESDNPTEFNYMINLITSSLSYNIIYDESVENVLDFYNLGNELRSNGFFSVEGNILFFCVSVYIAKTFPGAEITNPQAKIQIVIKPFLTVKN